MLRVVSVAAVAAFAAGQNASADLITALPGYAMKQTMYSGYINVNASHGRNLFYWLVEAQNNPETAPLFLWTNGGPGCSGIDGGLFSEQGPFRPNPDGSLSLIDNPWTWTANANIIFIEQPSGVGFSWSATPGDYVTGDYQSAEDVWAFLQGFYTRFPKYATRDFYLSSESYGGHYVPTEAKAIIAHNLAGDGVPVPFKGFLVGNAWTVPELDNTGALQHWYTRAMIDRATYEGVLATCNMSDVGPLLATYEGLRAEADWEVAAGVTAPARPLGFTPKLDAATGGAVTHKGMSCDDYSNAAFNLISDINIYQTFANVCGGNTPSSKGSKRASLKRSATATASVTAAGLGDSNNEAGCAVSYDPCVDDKTATYLNTPAVKAAIHANASITWTGCSSIVDYSRYDLLTPMYDTYAWIFANAPAPLRVLVVSGDVDAIVPTLGTVAWLEGLANRSTITQTVPIQFWLDPASTEVAGWTTGYDRLNFTTIRGAGHMVPGTQESRALAMFNAFLANTGFPGASNGGGGRR